MPASIVSIFGAQSGTASATSPLVTAAGQPVRAARVARWDLPAAGHHGEPVARTDQSRRRPGHRRPLHRAQHSRHPVRIVPGSLRADGGRTRGHRGLLRGHVRCARRSRRLRRGLLDAVRPGLRRLRRPLRDPARRPLPGLPSSVAGRRSEMIVGARRQRPPRPSSVRSLRSGRALPRWVLTPRRHPRRPSAGSSSGSNPTQTAVIE